MLRPDMETAKLAQAAADAVDTHEPLRQPTDEIVQRRTPDGRAVSREVVMHGIQLHQPS